MQIDKPGPILDGDSIVIHQTRVFIFDIEVIRLPCSTIEPYTAKPIILKALRENSTSRAIVIDFSAFESALCKLTVGIRRLLALGV